MAKVNFQAPVQERELMPEVDGDGFLLEPEKWNREVAVLLAQQEGVENPVEDHWKVIDCVRNYYQEFGVAPPARLVGKRIGFDVEYIYNLFPSGFAKGACKIAGLPKPDPHLFGHPHRDC